MVADSSESSSWYRHGEFTFALLDSSHPDFDQPITPDFIDRYTEHNPRINAIAKRLGERSIPPDIKPYILDELDESNQRMLTLVIPSDDAEAVRCFDLMVLETRASIGAIEN